MRKFVLESVQNDSSNSWKNLVIAQTIFNDSNDPKLRLSSARNVERYLFEEKRRKRKLTSDKK